MSRKPILKLIALAALIQLHTGMIRAGSWQEVGRRIEPEIQRAMIEGKIPSCTVALVAGDQIVWTGAYGYSNLWARTPATISTVYLIGSTFKTISTAALLQQMENGAFGLDDPVRDHLDGLTIRGEDSTSPITFRHLLTHTSGLPGAFGPHRVWGDSVPRPIEDYLRDSLKADTLPEEKVVYSNMAFTLIAYLVEEFSGRPYRTYMQEEIFSPLEMEQTVFEPTPAMVERLAIPYAIDSKTGAHIPAERLKADVWPAGIVYGTVQNQAHWLIAVLNGGTFKGKRLLGPETVWATLERQFEEFGCPMTAGWGNETAGFGLTWWVSEKNGERHFAHSGSVPGYTAFLEGNADRRLGFAILTNGHRSHPHLVALADKAIRILKEESSSEGQLE